MEAISAMLMSSFILVFALLVLIVFLASKSNSEKVKEDIRKIKEQVESK